MKCSIILGELNKKALAFFVNGNPVTVKSVMHPPLPARPFLGASNDDRAAIQSAIADFLNDQFKAIG